MTTGTAGGRALGLAPLIAAALTLAACGGGSQSPSRSSSAALPPDYIAVPAGRGPGYRLPAASPAVRARLPIGGLRCGAQGPTIPIHLELYAARLVVPVPAGIGVGGRVRRAGAYITGGACVYPVRSFAPTGVLLVSAGRPLTLGQAFAIWGQPLGPRGMAGFAGAVAAFVGGRRWSGSPRSIPLHRHAEIVLVSGGGILPHPAYRFPPGQ